MTLRERNARELKRELSSVFGGLVSETEAKVLARVLVEYPGTRSDLLPDTIRNDLTASAAEIEAALESLVEQGVFVRPDDAADDRSPSFVEPVSDGGFLERLTAWIGESGTETHVERFESIIDDLERRFADELVERRVDVISRASSTEGTETFKEDLDWEKYSSVSEIRLSAFSLETIPGFLEESLSTALENGVDVRVLLLHPDLGAEIERPRVREEIERGMRSIEELQRRCADAPGSLSYRLVRQREHAYFYGLLVDSRNDAECTYRVFVRDLGNERGVSSILVRGNDETTMYLLLSKYFEQAWESAYQPGWTGVVRRNWIYGLTVVPVLGLYLWVIGAIDDLSFALVQSVAIPIAAELVKDGVFALGNR